MKCPKCHIENPDDNKFCRESRVALLSVCTNFGNDMQDGNKLFDQCEQKDF
jgi:hypothetical protein